MVPRAVLTRLLVLLVPLAVTPGELTGQEPQARGTVGETRHVTSPAGDVSIAYHVAGNEGPTVLFVHGWMCDRTYWEKQVDYFSDRFRVVTMDLAGHGESGRNRSDWSLEAYAQDVVAVADALGSDQLVLVGHSSGGPIVTEAARRLAGRVAGIVGVDTFFDSWAGEAQEGHADLIKALRKNFGETTVSWVSNGMFLPGADSLFSRQIARDMASGPREVGVQSMQGTAIWLDTNFPAVLSEFNTPIGVIQSELNSDDLTIADSVGTQTGPLRIRLIPGTGHFLMRERPEAFNRALESMLRDWTDGSRADA